MAFADPVEHALDLIETQAETADDSDDTLDMFSKPFKSDFAGPARQPGVRRTRPP